jgi:undecaprenyl-diphosphatase
MTNFGSFLAILYIFRKDIKKILSDFFNYIKSKNKDYYDGFKYALLIIIGTIPAGFVGIFVKKYGVFDILENNLKFVGITLIITGIFLFLVRNIKGIKEDKDISYKDALFIGLCQVIALIPGISRSGATLIGGMKSYLKREEAFKFSFMLYFPISVATMALETKDLFESNINSYDLSLYIIATIVAMVVTFFSLKWFRKIMKEGKLIYFVIYCLIAGALITAFL